MFVQFNDVYKLSTFDIYLKQINTPMWEISYVQGNYCTRILKDSEKFKITFVCFLKVPINLMFLIIYCRVFDLNFFLSKRINVLNIVLIDTLMFSEILNKIFFVVSTNFNSIKKY